MWFALPRGYVQAGGKQGPKIPLRVLAYFYFCHCHENLPSGVSGPRIMRHLWSWLEQNPQPGEKANRPKNRSRGPRWVQPRSANPIGLQLCEHENKGLLLEATEIEGWFVTKHYHWKSWRVEVMARVNRKIRQSKDWKYPLPEGGVIFSLG